MSEYIIKIETDMDGVEKYNEAIRRLSVVWKASQAKKEVEHGKQTDD